jgi:hypothetical protein
MQSSVKNWVKAVVLVVIGLAIAVAGVLVGEYDDAPGAGVGGIVLMVVAVVFAVRIARRKT